MQDYKFLRATAAIPPWLTSGHTHIHTQSILTSLYDKSSPGDEIPERDVTYHLI